MTMNLGAALSRRKVMFYDTESFLKYSCFVFYTPHDDVWKVIEFESEGSEKNAKSTSELWTLYNKILREYILVGYNCKKYDNLILLSLFRDGVLGDTVISSEHINDLSDQIINTQTLKWVNIPEGFLSYDAYNFKNHMPSLKIVGTIFKGDIRETPIPFTYKGSFGRKDKEETVMYCKHDVQMTSRIFNSELGQKYFRMENKTAEVAFNEVKDVCRSDFMFRLYSTACDHYEEIVKILTKYEYKAPSGSPEDEFGLKYPRVLDGVRDFVGLYGGKGAKLKFDDVLHFFYSAYSYERRSASCGKEMSDFKIELRDNVTVAYGLGGAHGTFEDALAVKSDRGFKILHADFSAMYPSIMIAYDFFPPGLPPHVKDIFKKFAKARDDFKKAGDKASSDAYKPILNSVPGRFRYKFSKMYHPATNFSICALGQTLLTAMALVMKGRLIQADTDGIMVLCRDEDYTENENVIKKFEKLINLKIKVEPYKRFVQQNLHSYAYTDEHGAIGGIGGFFGRKSPWDPNLTVIPDVINRCLSRGITVRQALLENIREFGVEQLVFVSKTTAKFNAFQMQDFKTGKTYKWDNRFLLSVAVIGTEAVKLGYEPVSITKVGDGKVQKISSFPPVVLNINRLKSDLPLSVIDIDFYIELIMSKMKGVSELIGIKAR